MCLAKGGFIWEIFHNSIIRVVLIRNLPFIKRRSPTTHKWNFDIKTKVLAAYLASGAKNNLNHNDGFTKVSRYE